MSIISNINCLMGFHDTTSYSAILDYDGAAMLAVAMQLNDNMNEGFLNLCATRCKNCSYHLGATIPNNFEALEGVQRDDKTRSTKADTCPTTLVV